MPGTRTSRPRRLLFALLAMLSSLAALEGGARLVARRIPIAGLDADPFFGFFGFQTFFEALPSAADSLRTRPAMSTIR